MGSQRLQFWWFILFLLLLPGMVVARSGPAVSIGVVTDGQTRESDAYFTNLGVELRRLLGARYNVRIEERYILSANWQAERVQRL